MQILSPIDGDILDIRKRAGETVDEGTAALTVLTVDPLWLEVSIPTLEAAFGSVIIGRLQRTVRDVKQLGQYTLEEKIGEGAMGRVYRATYAMLRRPTAVKLLEYAGPCALATETGGC